MNRQTRCLKVGRHPQRDPAVAEAARLLQAGELVAFPTETVYGLGGNALEKATVQRIFEVKRRPSDNPLIVHISGLEMLARFSDAKGDLLEALAAAFWPGPLTLVLPAREQARNTVTCGLPTVALRVPNHPLALALIKQADLGLAAPSANLSGRPSPTSAKHVMDDLAGAIPLVIDGGECKIGLESTVLDLSGDEPLILRPGLILPEDIEAAVGVLPKYNTDSEAAKRTPGSRYRHYSPTVPVILLRQRVDDYSFSQLVRFLYAKGKVAYLGPRNPIANLILQPANRETLPGLLYATFRRWEDERVAFIIVDSVTPKGEGISIMDRLNRAATVTLEDRNAVMTFIAKGRRP